MLALALLLRLVWIGVQGRRFDQRLGDQREYLDLGRNLLHQGQLYFHDDRFDQNVYAYRTPGYPVFVAVCGGHVLAIRIAQALLDTSTVLAIYLLAARWLDRRSALAAAALVAFNPFLIYFTPLILSETLFTALLAWGTCLLRPSPLRSTPAILLLTCAAMVRPSALGLAPMLVLVGAPCLGADWKRTLGSLLALSGCLLLVFSLWAARNAHHSQLRTAVWTTTNGGITRYDGFHDAATGASEQKSFVDRLLPDLRQMNEIERDRFFADQARKWLRDHPKESAKLAVIKIARTWSPVPLSNDYRTAIYVTAGLIYSLPFDILFLLGLCRPQTPRSVKLLLVIPAIYFTAIHALSVGSLRYRIPAEPPMALIAGSALGTWISRRPDNSRRSSSSSNSNSHPQESSSPLNGPSRLDNPGRPV
jgi:4-amino-4-deoxy-L-arabinose transferase-like glycosyltransferase